MTPALNALRARLDPALYTDDPELMAPKLAEWRGRWIGRTPLLVRPRSTAEAAQVVRACQELGLAITPQGGNTGLVGGQIPDGEILVSMERMKAIRDVSPLDDAIVAEAGATLTAVHEAALAAGRFFPLSLASQDSASIGGLISTNAGGVAVLRYGTMRDLVLGIEAVLPNGEVVHGLKRLRKDNTGYDLKHLIIGAEGTLGLITAASLKLFPILPSRAVAMVGLADPEAAVALLALAKTESGGAVEGFELISARGMGFAVAHLPGARRPLAGDHGWYVLMELASGEPGAAEAALERVLARALEQGLAEDAVVAQSEAQAHALWALREGQSAAQKPEGMAWKHDVSVPVSLVARFIAEATAAVEAFAPGARVAAFGHVGDGNIHFDVVQPVGGDPAEHLARRDEGARIVHDIAHRLGGSISAEHGLGTMKTAEALRYKDPATVAALRAVRQALDPQRLMNPRVLF
jgi:FAD/FMN-containing dehydrogenase